MWEKADNAVEEDVIEIDTDVPMGNAMSTNAKWMGSMDDGSKATPVTGYVSKPKLALAQPQPFPNNYLKHVALFNFQMVFPKLQRPINDALKQCRTLMPIFHDADKLVVVAVMKG